MNRMNRVYAMFVTVPFLALGGCSTIHGWCSKGGTAVAAPVTAQPAAPAPEPPMVTAPAPAPMPAPTSPKVRE